MEIIVKVDPARAGEPAEHVREVVGATQPGLVEVEEVFPGLRSGRSAGLVSLTLPDQLASSAREAVLAALRSDAAVEYVEAPKPRRAR